MVDPRKMTVSDCWRLFTANKPTQLCPYIAYTFTYAFQISRCLNIFLKDLENSELALSDVTVGCLHKCPFDWMGYARMLTLQVEIEEVEDISETGWKVLCATLRTWPLVLLINQGWRCSHGLSKPLPRE